MRGAPPGGCRCHQQPPGVGLARAYGAFGRIAEVFLVAPPLGPCRCSRSVPAASPPCAGCARVSVEPLPLHALRVAVAYLAPGGPKRDQVAPRPVPPTRPAWCRGPRWGRRDGGRLGLSKSRSLDWVGQRRRGVAVLRALAVSAGTRRHGVRDAPGARRQGSGSTGPRAAQGAQHAGARSRGEKERRTRGAPGPPLGDGRVIADPELERNPKVQNQGRK